MTMLHSPTLIKICYYKSLRGTLFSRMNAKETLIIIKEKGKREKKICTYMDVVAVTFMIRKKNHGHSYGHAHFAHPSRDSQL